MTTNVCEKKTKYMGTCFVVVPLALPCIFPRVYFFAQLLIGEIPNDHFLFSGNYLLSIPVSDVREAYGNCDDRDDDDIDT